MKHRRSNTDGFVIPRRVASPGGDKPSLDVSKESLPPKYLVDPADPHKHANASQLTGTTRPQVVNPGHSVSHKDLGIDLSLDDEPPKSRGDRRRDRRNKKDKISGKRPWVKRAIIIAIVLVVLAGLSLGGYFVFKFLSTGSKIFKGNVVSAIFNQAKPLQQDANGRTNILLFGTSEDDPGHPGGDLTDSIMVVSVNQTKKDAFLVSIPRDLWVDYSRTCPAGLQGRINALYSCVKSQGEETAQEALRKKVGQVLGLDVQYATHLNYTALRQAVDAVGGITVVIDSKDSRGVLDRNFDWDCPKGSQTCYNVKYPNGPVQLDGKHALYLARARGDDPLGRTYGFPQANFDREKYQRAILIALKDKAVSAGTLANPVAVNNLLDALGNNVRTNFDAEEIKTLVKLGQDVNSNDIMSLPLNDPDHPLVNTGNINGQSIVKPVAGVGVYTDIQATVKAYATGNFVAIEKAPVDVLNASGEAGKAQTQADSLEDAGFKVVKISNAPTTLNTAPIQLYDLSGGKKPQTLKKLQSMLGVTAKTTLPAGISSNSDFVVIIGTTPASNTSSH